MISAEYKVYNIAMARDSRWLKCIAINFSACMQIVEKQSCHLEYRVQSTECGIEE